MHADMVFTSKTGDPLFMFPRAALLRSSVTATYQLDLQSMGARPVVLLRGLGKVPQAAKSDTFVCVAVLQYMAVSHHPFSASLYLCIESF